MQRRMFTLAAAAALSAGAPSWAHAQQKNKGLATGWAALETTAAGRLGVAVLDTAGGTLQGHRLDERFPMCSTFKWLAGALVLSRVDAGQEQLARRIHFGRDVLLPHSPVTQLHAGGAGMTVGELCEATITTSDNAAANLLLDTFGGPAAITRYARTLGDTTTRLDRREPELNQSAPGDPRDTTTPRGMATALRTALLGDALSPAGRAQLVRWMQATRTNGQRLGANLPAGWVLGSKTGTGARGSTNDVGVYWPPGRAPVVVVAMLTQTTAPEAVRNGALAGVARAVTGA